MSRALKDGVRALQAWILASTSRSTKIVRGQGTPGTRAAPAQTTVNDSNIGVRLDNAETLTKDGKLYKRYKLQANKNASNATIRDMANKNSHQVYAVADVPIDDSTSTEDKISTLFQDLEKDIEERMKG